MDIEYSLTLHLSSAAQADAVLKTFAPCEDISTGKVPAGDFRRDWELLFEDVPDLDSFRETADDITSSMEDLANVDPETACSARFLILNGSGDGNLAADYSFKDGVLRVQIMETPDAVICECPECGEELEEEIELEKHRHGKTYTCPACGAEFTFEEESFDEETIEI